MAARPSSGLAAASTPFQAALVALFLAGIAAPPLVTVLRDADAAAAAGARENRRAASFPEAPGSAAELAAFPEAFDGWYRDAFGLRATLVRWNSIAKVFGLGVSPIPTHLVGRGRWIFAVSERSIDAVRGVDALDEDEMRAWQRDLEARAAFVEERGGRFLHVLVPHKGGVYPDRLPDRLAPVGPTRLQRFLAHMREHSDVEMVDLRDAFARAREDDTDDRHLYSPHGVHWTASGAWVAAGVILDALGEDALADGRWRAEDVEFVGRVDPADSWARRLYLEDLLVQRRSRPRRLRPRLARRLPEPTSGRARDSSYARRDVDRPYAVVLHDSFGTELVPFLADSFGRLEAWRWQDFDAARIDRERPDVVIQVYSELTLVGMRPARAADLAADPLLPLFRASSERRMSVGRAADLAPHALGGPFEAEDVGGGVRVVVRGANALLELPGLPLRREGERRVLGLEIDAPARAQLAVFYRMPGSKALERRSAFLFTLEPGPNERAVELPDVDFEAPLVLGFGRSEEPFVLRSLEVRVVR